MTNSQLQAGTQVPRLPQVEDQIQCLEKTTDRLTSLVQKLPERFSKLLHSAPQPVTGQQTAPPRPLLVPLAEAIYSNDRRLSEAAELIENLIRDVEI